MTHLMTRRWALAASQMAVVALGLILWQVAGDRNWIDPFFFGSPLKTFKLLITWWGDGSLVRNIVSTLEVFAIGYVAGLVSGIGLGFAIGFSATLRAIVEPFLAFFNALPRLILQPFLIIVLGFGIEMKVTFVVLVIVFIVIANVASGVRETSRDYVDNARIWGAGRRDLLTEVYLPSVALWILSSARSTVGVAFQAAIISEFIGQATGLGSVVARGQNNLDVNQIWAALLIVVLLSVGMDVFLRFQQSRVMRWMPQQ